MAAPLGDDDADEILKDDFYGLLNIRREATREEINQAYKRLSKIYHPDKHQDPVKKKHAETLFTKLKKAHEILIDEHKRVIYDLYGDKGLESYGMEVISRTKTPAEIIAEYERFQKEQEERRLEQRTNPRGTVIVGLNATDLFDRPSEYEGEEFAQSSQPEIEINQMSLTQSVECPLTTQNTAILAGTVSSQNGTGTGVFMATWRRLMSNRGWTELMVAVGDNPSVSLKASKEIFKRCVGTVTGKMLFTGKGVRPGLNGLITYQIDKNIQGRIRYNATFPSSLSSMIVYNTEKHQTVFSIQVGVKATFAFISHTWRFPDQGTSAIVAVKAGTFGAVLEYGVEKKISTFSVVGATMSIGLPTGVSLRLKIERGQQSFVFPISLSQEVVPNAIFYGTVVPIAVYFVVKKLIINPFLTEQKERVLEKTKQDQMEKMHQQKQEAQALIDLMVETVERSIEVEERKNGLIVVKALYGKLVTDDQGDLTDKECIDVVIPLQALVKDSKLISPDKNSKSSLPGFYDPCVGEDKTLYIRYKFRGRLHHVTLEDTDNIRLPQQRHVMRDGEALESSPSTSSFNT